MIRYQDTMSYPETIFVYTHIGKQLFALPIHVCYTLTSPLFKFSFFLRIHIKRFICQKRLVRERESLTEILTHDYCHTSRMDQFVVSLNHKKLISEIFYVLYIEVYITHIRVDNALERVAI
jgi:hypothetical protein